MTPRRDDRRRQILDAAFAVFIQYGYAKTTFEDVARKAEVSATLTGDEAPPQPPG